MISELRVALNLNFARRLMNKTMTRGLVLLAGLWSMGVSDVQAQATDLPRLFLNVNVGKQSHTHTLSTNQSFSIYAEPATVSSAQSVSGGLLVDIGIGYRVMNNLAVAISGSRTSHESEAAVVAIIPHPIFFDRPRTTTATVEGLLRRETGIHVQAMWFLPVSGFLPGARLAFTAGPSFFTVRQGLVSGVSVPAGTQDAIPTVVSERESAVGVNVGFDLAYPIVARMGSGAFAPQIGVGVFVRYAGASFDFPSAEGEKAGGLQVGAGLRLGF
jgi:hypothetical protein